MIVKKINVLSTLFLLHVVLALGLSNAYAIDIGYLAEISIARNDNLNNLDPEDDVEAETINVLSGRVIFYEDAPEINAYVDLGVSSVDYMNDVAEDERVYSLTSNAAWLLLEERLTLRYSDYFQQVTIDTTGSITPDNLEDSNVFTIGPELRLPVGATSALSLEYRYINNYYELTEADSDGSEGIARFIHRSSPTSTYGINYEERRVDYFNDELNQDYTTKNLYLSAEWSTVTNMLRVEAGKTLLQREDYEDTAVTSGNLRFTRTVSPSVQWMFRVSRDLTDSAQTLGGTLENQESSTSVDTEAGTTFILDRAILSINRNDTFGTQSFEVYGGRIDYEDDLLDQEIVGTNLILTRNFGQDKILGFRGRYEKTEYQTVARDDRLTQLEISYLYKFQRYMRLKLSYTRETLQNNVSFDEYITNVYLLSLAYDTTEQLLGIRERQARTRREIQNQTQQGNRPEQETQN